MSRRLSFPRGILFLSFTLAGCSQSGAEAIPVSGLVTWKGQPVARGQIVFAPLDGKGVEAAGPIENGAYDFDVPAGKKRVRIQATQPEERPNSSMRRSARDNVLPASYGADSTLEATVKPDAENRFEFHLVDPSAGR